MKFRTSLYRLKVKFVRIIFGILYQTNVRAIDKFGSLKGVKEIIIRSGYNVDFNVYRSVYNDSINEGILKEASERMLDVKLIEIENGRICTNHGNSIGVFSGDNYLLKEYSFTYGMREVGSNGHLPIEKNTFYKFTAIPKPRKIKGTVVSLLTGGGKKINFYHWFCDSISRLEIIKNKFSLEEISFFLVPSVEERFQRETFQILGIPLNKIISSIDEPHLIAEKLVVTTHPRLSTFHISKESAKFLQSIFSSIKTNKKEFKKVYYFSRGDVTRRRILNEEELLIELKKLNIEIINPSQFNLRQMSILLSEATTIISVHSGALTNLILRKNKLKVIELFTEDFILPYYYELAQSLGFEYYYHVSKRNFSTDIKSRYEGQFKDITLDVGGIIDFIKFKI